MTKIWSEQVKDHRDHFLKLLVVRGDAHHSVKDKTFQIEFRVITRSQKSHFEIAGL